MSAKDNVVVVGGEPRIDFLPPEIREKKQFRRRIRALIMLVVVVAAGCVVAYVGVSTLALSAQVALAAEQDRTRELIQAQNQYSEARMVESRVAAIRDARLVASANAVRWADYIAELQATMPEGGVVTGVTVDSFSATEAVAVEADPLYAVPTVGVLIDATLPSLAAIADWVDALEQVSGVVAYTPGSATLSEGGYTIQVGVSASEERFERRYFESPGSEPAGEATEGAGQ
ncbi:MAG: hypothetical protein IR160_08715 [Salinibacterium sp.]|nr:hypothetical protein [Salinibacterium sp.]MBF0672653.1 hypothetical protein [Salinibacterium sp.]